MKRKLLIILTINLMLLTGCWDLSEIEQISFVIASALDPMDDEELIEKYEMETGRPIPKGMFQLTNQVVIPSLIKGGGGEGGGGNPDEGPFFNVRTAGMTSFKNVRNFTTRRSRTMNYEHLKVLIINEELARAGMISKLSDFFARDHAMRRDILVFVSKGKGYEILEHKLPLEIMPAISIEMISGNAERGGSIPKQIFIGDLISSVAGDRSYIIPRIVKTGGQGIKLAGAAVFCGKENQMVGWLGEYDVQGHSWITGDVENEVLEAFYGSEQKPFVFETDFSEANVEYKHENGKDIFDITIKTEGFFVDNWISTINLDSQETIRKLEAAVAEEIKRQVAHVIEKMQNEFFTDIFQFHEQVRIDDYSYWEEVKDRWDGKGGAFSKAEISVEAEVEIRHTMLIHELEEN